MLSRLLRALLCLALAVPSAHAARAFDDAATQYLELGSAVVTSADLSISARFNSDDATLQQLIVGIYTAAGISRWSLLIVGSIAGDPVRAQSITTGGVSAAASTTTGYTANTWHTATGVWIGSANRSAFIDGGSKNNDTNSRVVSGVDRTGVGSQIISGARATYFSGKVAEVVIYNIALSDADVANLHAAKGVPWGVHPEAIVGYWPLWGVASPEVDLRASNGMTVTGATAADHPPVYYAWAPIRIWRGTVAAGGGQPTMRRWINVPYMGGMGTGGRRRVYQPTGEAFEEELPCVGCPAR